jgi:carbonic anhydrase/acetyltransferase-like protein (isoleucine patch superfamily)
VIGRNCVIGANSLIPERKKIPDGSLVVGSPGRVVRKLTDEEIREFSSTAAHYVQAWQRYKAALEPDPS